MPTDIFLQQGISEFRIVLLEQVGKVKTLGLFIKELVKVDEGNDVLKKWNRAGALIIIMCSYSLHILHLRVTKKTV